MAGSDVLMPIIESSGGCSLRGGNHVQYESAPTPPPACRDGASLLTHLLDDQKALPAVEEFSESHDRGRLPDGENRYSSLLPATTPGPGQQYAFEVDLDRCSGCKACVAACHSLNGLDDQESWRDVGLLMGGSPANPVMQHVTTACHHCLDPACMTACPVDAYEKDPVTGIVRHLDDQCFGCQYCTLACPYDVPKYHKEKGIVRKCDMCSDRLAEGEAPACAQSCPHEAISITLAGAADVRENAETDRFLPDAPAPHLTFPTTTFKTERVFPRNLLPADYYAVNPQHPHWPLIIMLVLSQLSVGTFAVGLAIGRTFGAGLPDRFVPFQAALALAAGLLALGASTFHLGRPQYAFRAVIGLRHSWLSREIVAFGLFAGAASLYSAAVWSGVVSTNTEQFLGATVVASGLAGVFCSAMIYVFTKRAFWSFERTIVKFGLTAFNLGLATTWLALMCLVAVYPSNEATRWLARVTPWMCSLFILGTVVKLLYESAILFHHFARTQTSMKRSARLTSGPLSRLFCCRLACGTIGGVVLPFYVLSDAPTGLGDDVGYILTALILFILSLVGELLERYHFFAAVAAPRMPGNPRP